MALVEWFSPSTSVSLANSHCTNCSAFINHPITFNQQFSLHTDSIIKQPTYKKGDRSNFVLKADHVTTIFCSSSLECLLFTFFWIYLYNFQLPVTVAERSRYELCSLARMPWSWDWIPLRAWMFGVCVCVRLFCACVVLYLGRGLTTGWSLVQGVLPTVYRSKEKRKPRHRKSNI
jgi:hypothetical protein